MTMRIAAVIVFFLSVFCLPVFCVAGLPAGPARADEPQLRGAHHAIAMHGAPKYKPGFTHLDYANPDAPKGGTLRHGITGTFDNLHVNTIKGQPAAGLGMIYDSLMARVWDEPFTMYGLVAGSVDMPEDRSEITFYLRPEARFHDGEPLTAEDVVFSFEALKEHGKPVTRHIYSLVEKVDVIDDYTVRFVFSPEHDAETAMILSMMPVMPKHYWQGRDFDKTTLDAPLGSGPYRIAEVEPGRKIVYERVRDYWAADLPINVGFYNFDTVIYDYYRDDTVAMEAFKAGNYDLRRESNGTKWTLSYDFPAVRDGDVVLEELEHGRPEYARSLIFNTRREIFADRAVREALGYAFDFEWMNAKLLHGMYKRIDSYFPNSELAASGAPGALELAVLDEWRGQVPDQVFGTAYAPPETAGKGAALRRKNLRTAMAILKKAGWVIRDGVLVNAKTGRKLSFEILLRNPEDEKVALAYVESLKRIGVDAGVRTVDSAQFTRRLNDFDYDMVLFRWINSLSPGNEQLNYWGSAAADLPGSRNYAGVKSPAVDAVAASIGESKTREELVARTRALDRLLTWGYYGVPLYYLGRDLVAYRAGLKRPEVTPVYGMVIETWWRDVSSTN